VDAPLFITWFQCAVTAGACYGILALPPNFGDSLACGNLTISLQTLKKVLPLSVVFVAMITFNNLCLKNVGISFYYIGRSLTTVFNVAFTYLILGQKTSVRAISCCFIIILGFWLGVDQESNSGSLSFSGTLYGVLASLFVSLYAIYIKRILPVVDNNVWLLTFYNNVNAVLLFIPMMLVFGEFPVIWGFDQLFSPTFWLLMTLGGIFGCAIGYVTGLQVKVTSPLTHNISGTAKAAAQTVLATHVNAEIKSFWWWVSNFVVLMGSAAYARVRQLEMASDKQREILPSSTTSAEIEKEKEIKP
jgi:GDP-fucose transporter C1